MTYVSDTLRRIVAERAHDRCEYCKLPESNTYAAFQIDHIIATKHGGKTTETNLCLSCASCNGHKGSDLASLNPRTEKITLLFNPRTDRWSDHFKLNGAFIEGLTQRGELPHDCYNLILKPNYKSVNCCWLRVYTMI